MQATRNKRHNKIHYAEIGITTLSLSMVRNGMMTVHSFVLSYLDKKRILYWPKTFCNVETSII